MLIGVTGNIGSGKSTAVAHLRDALGAGVVDADGVGHHLLATNREIQASVSREFGGDLVGPGGHIDRRQLGKRVFANPEALEALNRIFYPHLTYEIKVEIQRAQRVFNHVILDAALIIEWGFRKEMDKLIVVTSLPEIRVKRLTEFRRMLEDEARERVNAQAPESLKAAQGDFVVKNNGSPEKLKKEMDKIAKQILALL